MYYSSGDLYNWKFEGLAFSPDENTESGIARGCVMERPEVIYNETRKYVMWFHLELKGQGYKVNGIRRNSKDSRYLWLPISFINSNIPLNGKTNGNLEDLKN